jgi:ketosteroid isomerase-like protein
MIERATALLAAFARSDLATIERLCADDVLLWGTDEGEVWAGRAAILEAFAGAFDLGVRWTAEPVARGDWVAGRVEFDLGDGTAVPARVSMVFRDGLLAHAHYSIAAGP